MIDYYAAIRFLFPKAEFEIVLAGVYEGIVWLSTDIEKPTEEELRAAWDAHLLSLKINEYKKKRIAEYPSIGDQLDAIMKWVSTEREISVPSELKSVAMKCMSVKAKYPKPEQSE